MQIDIFQDYVCPWCRIGKKNLADALATWRESYDGEITVAYHAYQLNPDVPPEGDDFERVMASKFGGSAPIAAATQQVTQAGAAVGLTFRFDRITRMPNTLLAHRLTAIAPQSATDALVEALHEAYFAEGRDLSDQTVLASILTDIGLDAEDLLARANGGEGGAEVAADLQQAQDIGVRGVPFFIFNRKYAVSGAYPPAELIRLLDKAAGRADEL